MTKHLIFHEYSKEHSCLCISIKKSLFFYHFGKIFSVIQLLKHFTNAYFQPIAKPPRKYMRRHMFPSIRLLHLIFALKNAFLYKQAQSSKATEANILLVFSAPHSFNKRADLSGCCNRPIHSKQGTQTHHRFFAQKH